MRRALAALGVAAVVLATAACGSQACTLIGGRNVLAVAVSPAVRADLASVDVEVCQADRCGQVSFPVRPPDPRFLHVREGVALDEDGSFVIDAEAFGRSWDPDVPGRVVVRGLSSDGRAVARHVESFDFRRSYPNGKACDGTPYLSHTTRVGAQDRTSG